jgi:hypothetical protein
MLTTISLTMEELPHFPNITIINRLPTPNAHFPNDHIDVSDTIKFNYRYNNQSYAPDDDTVTLCSNHAIRFSPRTHERLPEYKRFGMNNTGDTALIALYVHAAITRPLIHLIVGKGSPIQFGDTIIFMTQSDDTIILNHNAKKLTERKTKETIRIIPEPKFFGDCITIQLTQTPKSTNPIKTHIQSTGLSADTMGASPCITIINQLPTNNPHLPSTHIDVSEKTKYNAYTNKSHTPDESTITISSHETKQFPLHLNEANSTSLTFYVHDAVENQLFQLNIGKGSKVKCGDTITLTPKPSHKIAIKHNDKNTLITLDTTQCAELIGLPDITTDKLLSKYGCYPQDWHNDFPYIYGIYSQRFAKENL